MVAIRNSEFHIDKELIVCLLSSLAVGIAAHGSMLFNKFSWFDDLGNMTSIGMTWGLGRWMLGIIEAFIVKVLGTTLYSTPVFNGFFTLLCIGTASWILCRMLKIERTSELVLLTGVLVVNPAVTSLFGYMFTAPAYGIGILSMVAAAYLICLGDKWKQAAGIFLSACSIGIYQADLSILLSVLCLFLMRECLEQKLTKSELIKSFLKKIDAAVISLVIYLLCNRCFLAIRHSSLSDYQNVSSFGVTSPGMYLQRIVNAYQQFFFPELKASFNLYPGWMRTLYLLLLVLWGVLLIRYLRSDAERNTKAQVLLLNLLFPLAAGFIFVLTDFQYTIMMYGLSFTFWMPVLLWDHLPEEIPNLKKAGIAGACILLLGWCKYDNVCYLRAQFLQSEAISWFNTLITRMEMTEGYSDSLPVAYIGSDHKSDENLYDLEPFDDVITAPYSEKSLINDNCWREIMKYWCGFDPEEADASSFEELPEVKKMPSYPADGSIQVVKGTLVVKFSDQ